MFRDEPFLLTILDHPDDDGPRLVYADWLEEHGDGERADLIRLQCLGGDIRREAHIVSCRGRDWAGPISRLAYSYAYRRGFVEEITVDARTWLSHGQDIVGIAPIRLLRLIGARNVLDSLFESPALAGIRALHLTGCHIGDDGAALLAGCEHLARLQTLRLGTNAISDHGVESLAESWYLSGLHTLVLHGNLIGDPGAQILASTDQFANLQTLDLSDNLIGDGGAEALARAGHFPNLVRLDISNQFKGWTAGAAARGRPFPIQQKQQKALIARFGAAVCMF